MFPCSLFVIRCVPCQYFPSHCCHGYSTFHPIDKLQNLFIQARFGGPPGLLPNIQFQTMLIHTKHSQGSISGHSATHFLRNHSEEQAHWVTGRTRHFTVATGDLVGKTAESCQFALLSTVAEFPQSVSAALTVNLILIQFSSYPNPVVYGTSWVQEAIGLISITSESLLKIRSEAILSVQPFLFLNSYPPVLSLTLLTRWLTQISKYSRTVLILSDP